MIFVVGDAVSGKTTLLSKLASEADLIPIDFDPSEDYARHAMRECSLIKNGKMAVKELHSRALEFRAHNVKEMKPNTVEEALRFQELVHRPPKLIIFLADGPKRRLEDTPYMNVLRDILGKHAEDAAEVWFSKAWRVTTEMTFLSMLYSLARSLPDYRVIDVLVVGEDPIVERIKYVATTYNTPILVKTVDLDEAISSALEAIKSI